MRRQLGSQRQHDTAFFGAVWWRPGAREKSAAELKCIEEEQKQLEVQRQVQKECVAILLDYLKKHYDIQQQYYTAAIDQLQTDIAAVATEISTLRAVVTDESRLRSKSLVQFSKDMGMCFEANQAQIIEIDRTFCGQYTVLSKILES